MTGTQSPCPATPCCDGSNGHANALHVRIRELEAELARYKEHVAGLVYSPDGYRARAERAEKRIAELEAELAIRRRSWAARATHRANAAEARAEKAEARVAELERALEQRHGQIAAMLLEKAGRDYEHIPPEIREAKGED